jgi:hypothetical protein
MLGRLIKSMLGGGSARAAGNRVYVCLMGGLGNQLFQYAFARHLVAQGVAVSGLVTNLFASDGYARQSHVQAFSRIPAARLSKDELATLQILADNDGMAVRDALLHGVRTNVVCRGYWQDAVHANAVAAELAGDLQAYGESNFPAASEVECVVHVRRHEYGHHGLLPFAYYQAALAHCGSPRFAVVTDEPNFCDYMFKSVAGYAGVAPGDINDPWGDFFRLSKARVQIIANSTFSWWSAWLGRATGATTTVIAPAEWSLITGSNPCPGDWTRIDMRLARP